MPSTYGCACQNCCTCKIHPSLPIHPQFLSQQFRSSSPNITPLPTQEHPPSVHLPSMEHAVCHNRGPPMPLWLYSGGSETANTLCPAHHWQLIDGSGTVSCCCKLTDRIGQPILTDFPTLSVRHDLHSAFMEASLI